MSKRTTNPKAAAMGLKRKPLTGHVLKGLIEICEPISKAHPKMPKHSAQYAAMEWLRREVEMSGLLPSVQASADC